MILPRKKVLLIITGVIALVVLAGGELSFKTCRDLPRAGRDLL